MRDVEERAGALRAGRPDAKRSNDAGRGEAMPSGRANGIASSIGGPHRGVAVRLVLTVWIVYALHATTNVVRETYLAMAIGGHGSVRVDPYLGLHSDIFAIPGRGAYINNNPGASILGAVPYALSRPFVAVLVRVKPELARPKPAATYDDPRPNRTKFLNEARRRGLDVTLALAAIATQVGLMAPLGALAAAVMFNFLRARLGDDRRALWLALLYAVATPLLFRSGFLNQNAIIAHCVLFAFVLMAGGLVPSRPLPASAVRGEAPSTRALAGAGAFAGLAVLCDYSGVPLLLAFGGWALVRGWAVGGARVALRSGALFSLGAAVPLLTLLGYQWVAFGHPLFPAQRYMPAVQFSDRGWNGFSAPSAELLWRNLFDARYGLFVFCPMLVAALVAPFLRRRGTVPVAAAGVPRATGCRRGASSPSSSGRAERSTSSTPRISSRSCSGIPACGTWCRRCRSSSSRSCPCCCARRAARVGDRRTDAHHLVERGDGARERAGVARAGLHARAGAAGAAGDGEDRGRLLVAAAVRHVTDPAILARGRDAVAGVAHGAGESEGVGGWPRTSRGMPLRCFSRATAPSGVGRRRGASVSFLPRGQ